MPLTDDQLRDIALDAARTVFPPERIGDISASVGMAFDGEPAYRFVVHVDQVDDRDEAADMRISLRVALRDHLLAAGDETYPYVRILDRSPSPDPVELLEVARHLAA